MYVLSWLLTYAYFCFSLVFSADLNVTIDYKVPGFPVRNFWSSTGLTPQTPCNQKKSSQQMISKDMKVNLALIGSLPNQVVQQVRLHFLC